MPYIRDMGLLKPSLIVLTLFLLLPLSCPLLRADTVNPLSTLPPSLRHPATPNTEPHPDNMFTEMAIDKKISKHVMKDIEIHASSQSLPTRIHPQTITITILGPPFESVDAASFKKKIAAYVNVEHLSAGVYVKPARIKLPEGYVLVEARPEIFLLEIKPEDNSN